MTHSLLLLPPLEGLHAILAAGRCGSFTKAAEELGLTHGAVSRRVATVEAWLGTAVFERHGRGVFTTPAGQRFIRDVEQALSALEQTSERWRPPHRPASIRLSVLPSFAKLWLLPRMSELLKKLSGFHIEMLIEHRLADLEAREADVVVRYGRGGWPRLRVLPLFSETLQPVAAPAVAARFGPDADSSDLLRFALINDSDTSQWRGWFAAEGIRYRPRAHDWRFEDYDVALAAAEGGLGIALLRLPLAQEWLDSGRLVPVSPRMEANPFAHYLVYRRDEQRAPVLALVDALRAHAP